MILKLKRIKQTDTTTVGLLYVDNVFECFTLEDIHNEPKIYGKTRIPSGEYKLTFRTSGSTHQKYLKKFPDFHKGMLWVRDVPNFEYILIHLGNFSTDSDGCVLVGLYPSIDFKSVINSTVAYTRLYKKVMNEKDIKIIVEDE